MQRFGHHATQAGGRLSVVLCHYGVVTAGKRHLGADEIYRRKRQKFSTVLSDLVHGEAIGLAPDRTEASLAGLLTTCLDARQRAAVEAVFEAPTAPPVLAQTSVL